MPGESECSRDKIIDTALAEESRMAARLLNDAEIEKYKRDFQVYTLLEKFWRISQHVTNDASAKLYVT